MKVKYINTNIIRYRSTQEEEKNIKVRELSYACTYFISKSLFIGSYIDISYKKQ